MHAAAGGFLHSTDLCNLPMQVRDPFTVLIKEKKLPMSLLEDPEKKQQARLPLSSMAADPVPCISGTAPAEPAYTPGPTLPCIALI